MGNARPSLGLADHRKLHQKQNVARQGGMENLSHVRSVNQNMTKNHTRIIPKTITMTDLIKKENQMTFEEKYEELCDLIKGDSPNWTHEEIKARLEEQVDALIEKENG